MVRISEAVQIILAGNGRKIVMKDLGVSTALISSWRVASDDRVVRFETAVKIYGIYGIITYPYDKQALVDKWNEMEMSI